MLVNLVSCARSCSRGVFRKYCSSYLNRSYSTSLMTPKWQSAANAHKRASKIALRLQHSESSHLVTETFSAIPQTTSLVFDAEREEFISMFPDVVKDLTAESSEEGMVEADQYFAKALQYNVPNGKLNAGFATIATCKALLSSDEYIKDKYLINILGWCTELEGTWLYVTDDMIDSSLYRRGVPCWYRNEGVQLQAINDAEMICNASYAMLKKYFSKLACYVPLMELFHDVALNTAKGQTLDTVSVAGGKRSLDCFTVTRHNALANSRFNYTFFRLPVMSGIYFSNKYDSCTQKYVDRILYHLGHFAQVQNDILDCYGDPAATGKEGNDIQEGKCSWLVVQALLKATQTQQQVLERNYGRHDAECERAVRRVYEDLNLLSTYARYKIEITNKIYKDISYLGNKNLENLFHILAEIYIQGNEEYFIT